MKRSGISLDNIADQHTLWRAFGLAAHGKQGRADVEAFRSNLHANLNRLGEEIRTGQVSLQKMRCFTIRDPKPRVIHAPSFRDRVLHHALIQHVGPVLDRTLVDDSFACRDGKGAIAGVRRAQHFARRGRWYVKIDIASYFPSISHDLLMGHLARKFRDRGVLSLMEQIVCSHSDGPGRGLPIGALSSQHFANCFLGPVDRLIQQDARTVGYVRYMDDMVWWTQSKNAGLDVLSVVVAAVQEIDLVIKPAVVCRRVGEGLSFCGLRVLPKTIYASQRLRRRFASALEHAENRFLNEHRESCILQRDVDPVLATMAHCSVRKWQTKLLAKMPLAEAPDAA